MLVTNQGIVMLFTSFQFCIFFPITLFLYFIAPIEYAWLLLLVASSYFYLSSDILGAALISIAIMVNYGAALYIEKTSSSFYRKFCLTLSLIITFSLLFICKYMNFFYHSLYMLGFYNEYVPYPITLPIGISFFTFQAVSYTVDIFYKKYQAEHHLGKFALFILYFPQLVAGPIERGSHLLNQLTTRKPFSYHNIIIGLRTFLGGLLLKLVVADNLSKYVDAVYNNVHLYVGWPLLFATYLFAFQIFCDFAGYSYMAIGIARTMGITLMENFKQPYLADSIKDFWKRWHISLSTWFCDYIYIPLGGNKVSSVRYCGNIAITFLLSGLWHGANWTFIIWGALHSFYMIASYWLPDCFIRRVPSLMRIIGTFSAVCISWIFFRANTVHDACYILCHMFDQLTCWNNLLQLRRAVVMGRSYDISILFFLTVIIWGVHCVQRYAGKIRHMLDFFPTYVRLCIYYITIFTLFLWGEFGGYNFIYFQF